MIQAAALQEYYERYKEMLLVAILVIFHTVGLVGLTSEYRNDFLPLSFFNLTLSFVIVWFARYNRSTSWYIFVVVAFLIGMSVEWIGVHTGWLFGNYIYGENLGIKIAGVPLIIGINWVLLSVISSAVARRFTQNKIGLVFLGAMFMLLLDIVIEPVAIVSDYWVWSGDIPFSNFITWFVVALFLQFIFVSLNLVERNKVALVLYMIQLVFFVILNLAL